MKPTKIRTTVTATVHSNRKICWNCKRLSTKRFSAQKYKKRKCKNCRYVLQRFFFYFFYLKENAKRTRKFFFNFQAKINQKLLNSKVFNFEHQGLYRNTKKMNRLKSSGSAKARTMMNLHNNEAGRRVSKMQFFTNFTIVPL